MISEEPLPSLFVPMKISDEGIRLIKSFEGYHKKLANGDCCAYQTPLGGGKFDIPTIGYGVTEGVKMGMVWTEAQALEALEREIAKHEVHVLRLVKVEINQNEHDALTSFCYNCGPGNLAKLVVPLNRGDRAGTAKKFAAFNRAQGRVLPGLVSRRARETALFLKPVKAPEEPHMPQTVEKSIEPPHPATVAAGATAAGGGIAAYFHQFLDAIGMGDASIPDGWQDQAMGLLSQPGGGRLWTSLAALPMQHPAFLAAFVAGGLVLWLRLRAAQ